MTIRLLEKTNIAVIVNGFKESGWPRRRQGYGGTGLVYGLQIVKHETTEKEKRIFIHRWGYLKRSLT